MISITTTPTPITSLPIFTGSRLFNHECSTPGSVEISPDTSRLATGNVVATYAELASSALDVTRGNHNHRNRRVFGDFEARAPQEQSLTLSLTSRTDDEHVGVDRWRRHA